MVNLREELEEEFERQAEWRRNKAEQYSDDTRNLEAARLFDRLAETVRECPQDVIEAAWELFEDVDDGATWAEMMNSVGFRNFPSSAEEMLRGFITARTG